MHRALFVAVLLVLAWTSVAAAQVYSEDIPDPETFYLQRFTEERDLIYRRMHEALASPAVEGISIMFWLRVRYLQCAVASYRLGLETEAQFRDHLDKADFPEGSFLSGDTLEFKAIIVWLRRGQVSVDRAEAILDKMYQRIWGNRK